MADPLLTTAGSQVPPSSQTLNLRLGARLLAAADVFVFVGFLFAYLYLRSINAHGLWHPPHTSPSVALGSVTLVAMVGSALAVLYALRVLRSDHDDAWRAAAGVGLGLCVVALGVQLWQLFDPGFSPSSGGGFGSVFVGFTAVLVAHLVGATYWLETIVVGGRKHADAPELTVAAVGAYATFGLFLAGVEVVAFILFYLAA